MKEGCNINKSLHVLGMVISSLAEKSVKKNNNIVPYRLINFKINSKRFIINKNIVKCIRR
jgi:hypothetical protein